MRWILACLPWLLVLACGKEPPGTSSSGAEGAPPGSVAARPRVDPRRPPTRPASRGSAGPEVPAGRRPCGLPWGLTADMTLARVVRHFRERRIVVLHLRDFIVSIRPPAIGGVRLQRGRLFVDRAPGRTGPATFQRLELETTGLGGKAEAQALFRRLGLALSREVREVARRSWRPPPGPPRDPRRLQARWDWRCAGGAVGLSLRYARDESPAARGRYEVRLEWRVGPAPRPKDPRQPRFSAAATGLTVAAARGLLLRPGARWQDPTGLYDLSLLPNGRVVVLGGEGALEPLTGTWEAVVEGAGVEVRLAFGTDVFFAPRQTYRLGQCQLPAGGPWWCLKGVVPAELPFWMDRSAAVTPSVRSGGAR